MLSSKENTRCICWSAMVAVHTHTCYFRTSYPWRTLCSTSLIVMLSGRLYSPAVDLHAGLFEFDFMHVPPVAQAERVLYTPRKEAEKHATEPDGSRICAGPQAFCLFMDTGLDHKMCAGVIATTFSWVRNFVSGACPPRPVSSRHTCKSTVCTCRDDRLCSFHFRLCQVCP